MDKGMKKLLLLVFTTVFVCEQGWSFSVDISPSEIDAITSSPVNVSCVASTALDQYATEIMIVELLGIDGNPIVILRQNSGITYKTNSPEKYHVEGHIDKKTPSKSRLTLTLLNPTEADTGLYQCGIYFLDVVGLLTEVKAGANLTVSSKDVDSVVKYLVKKVSELDSELQARIHKETHLTNQVSRLENQVNTQILKVINLETERNEQREKETEMMKNVSRLEDKMKTHIIHENYVSAFNAKYSVKGPQNIGDTIVFDDVIMKVGQGYNEKTGIFTAPRSGIYEFNVVAATQTNIGYVELSLYVNTDVVGALAVIRDGSYNSQSSIGIFVQLKTGDDVKVVVNLNNQGTDIQASVFTFFSGYLLKERNGDTL